MTVKYFALIREVTQTKEDELEIKEADASLRGLLSHLCGRYGPPFRQNVCATDGSLQEGLILLLNGEAIKRDTFETRRLRDGDTVAIMPPVGGG